MKRFGFSRACSVVVPYRLSEMSTRSAVFGVARRKPNFTTHKAWLDYKARSITSLAHLPAVTFLSSFAFLLIRLEKSAKTEERALRTERKN